MKAKILLLALLGMLAYVQARITLADVQAAEWESFKVEFNKNYVDESEDRLRMRVFQDNKKIIDAHNERLAAGKETYEMGVNQFTDLLAKEFNSLFADNQDKSVNYGEADDSDLDFYEDNTELDETDYDMGSDQVTVDWRTIGAVTPVKSEGHFNNSWAFAAAGVVESRQFVSGGKLVVLSKQNLVDCCHSKKRKTLNALKCIKKMRGIDTEASYPYRGLSGKCRFKKKLIGATIKKYYRSSRTEKALARNVANGPVAAVISRDAIRFYKRGVFHNTHCGQSPDYAVLVVGYGTCQNCGDYWILKTSMGTSWGDKGYMRLARNKNNLCGIANNAYYPIIS